MLVNGLYLCLCFVLFVSLSRGRGGFTFVLHSLVTITPVVGYKSCLHKQLSLVHQLIVSLLNVKHGSLVSFHDLYLLLTFSCFSLHFQTHHAPLIRRNNWPFSTSPFHQAVHITVGTLSFFVKLKSCSNFIAHCLSPFSS